MSKIMLARDVAPKFIAMMEIAIADAMPEASESERELAKFRILSALARTKNVKRK